MRSGTSSGVIGRWTGVLTESFANAGDGEGGNLSDIFSKIGSGVTGRCVSAFVLCTDRVLLVLLKDVGDVGVELDVITKGEDDFGERGLSSFSMIESRFEVVILMSGRV